MADLIVLCFVTEKRSCAKPVWDAKTITKMNTLMNKGIGERQVQIYR